MNRKFGKLILFLFTGLILIAGFSQVTAQTMSVNPNMINLNAQGSSENLQCAYYGVIPSGYLISGQDIQIFFAGSYVMDAYNVDYCAIDNMIFVQFDWSALIGSPVLASLANTGQVVVSISGEFQATNSTGDVLVFPVNRWGYAEVIKPGKRK